MELQFGKSISELNEKAELPPDIVHNKNTKMLITSANKLFATAKKTFEEGNFENSYIYFMKYLNLVSCIKKTQLYRSDEKYYKDILVPRNVKQAIEYAENLQKKLLKEFERRHEESIVRKHLEDLEVAERKSKSEKSKGNIEPTSKDKSVEDDCISTWALDSLIKKQTDSFIIFDVRSSQDFEDSHIKHPNLYSIPQEILRAGLSAAGLYKELPVPTKIIWSKRLSADVIVLVDWHGSRETGSPVFILEEILTKWDPSSTYVGVIKLLIGGYDEWINRFPLQATNPLIQTNTAPIALSSTPIGDIYYPDLEVEIIPIKPNVPSVQPIIDRKAKPDVDIKPLGHIYLGDPPSVRDTGEAEPATELKKVAQAPEVNRNLKNSAVLKYLEEEEKLVERSLTMAQERLDQEKEWDRVRMEKESSIHNEIRAHLQEREEELIKCLKKMETDNKEQELEIGRLRKQVGDYKRRNQDIDQKTKKEGEEESIENRIRDKEKARSAMYQEVEKLRQLRKHKESENERIRRAAAAAEEEDERKKMQSAKREEANKNQDEDLKAKSRGEEQHELIKRPHAVNIVKLNDEPSSFGSKMNRSHSTPDLAQALQNEEFKPRVERTLKPRVIQPVFVKRHDLTRNRVNFNPVYGKTERGLTGLKNLGNTCYMNSIIQCISNTLLLTNFLVDDSYRDFMNQHNKITKGDITDEITAVLKALWSGQYRSISCTDFKAAVGRYKSSFRGYEQQDSHELLTILVDWLHEELNEISVKAPLKEQNNYDISDDRAARMAWDDYTNSNKSIVVKIFGGQQRSSLQCLSCRKESVTFEPFFNLSLPLPQSKNNCNITECFELYTRPELVSGWSCPFCKRQQDARKKIDIWELPPVLIVHLQRFYNDGMWRKRLTMVDFSVNDLELNRVVKSSNARYSRFKLYAVSNHYGTMDGGHYTAYCKNPVFNKWFKFDDQEVMEINGNEVRSAAAYILFYTAINYQPPPAILD